MDAPQQNRGVTGDQWGMLLSEEFPLRIREFLAVLAAIVLWDQAVYRGAGYFGWAVALVCLPILVAAGRYRRRIKGLTLFWQALLGILALKLTWLGDPAGVAIGILLVLGVTLSLSGTFPYPLRVLLYTLLLLPLGLFRMAHYYDRARRCDLHRIWGTGLLSVLLPLGMTLLFGLIFLFANPDLVRLVSTRLEFALDELLVLFADFRAVDLLFWGAMFWLMLGFLAPQLKYSDEVADLPEPVIEPAPLYAPFRNSLFMLILLFAAYLVFEFQTLWFREFPPGFYYSGYAHQGAAWLTTALGLATLVLSIMFRGRTLNDARIGTLKRLGWIWSIQNLLLAVSVYHRLGIYVGFNGMTRMRVIGYLGTTAVLIGFLLVVWKIRRGQRFSQLLQRQMLVPCLLAFLYVVLPVDLLITQYNVSRIMAGHLAPAVQISEHPLTDDALPALAPLLQSENATIRAGIQALWQRRYWELTRDYLRPDLRHWTAYQAGRRYAHAELQKWHSSARLPESFDADQNWKQFQEYAYQWY